MAITFTLNDRPVTLSMDEETPLLWALRDTLGLTGTKYGCGRGLCGCCTVLIEGEAARSCQVPLAALKGLRVHTIEWLAARPGNAVFTAWQEIDVPQCGYCQPGQIMSATSLLLKRDKVTDEDIDAAMSGVLCRCGTYPRIRVAIHRAAAMRAAEQKS